MDFSVTFRDILTEGLVSGRREICLLTKLQPPNNKHDCFVLGNLRCPQLTYKPKFQDRLQFFKEI